MEDYTIGGTILGLILLAIPILIIWLVVGWIRRGIKESREDKSWDRVRMKHISQSREREERYTKLKERDRREHGDLVADVKDLGRRSRDR